MIFKQLFDEKSSTYTYIVASGKGREALIIDPVIEHTSIYTDLFNDLDLSLVKTIDTHIHADHISAMAELKERTNCETIMGEHSKSEVVNLKVKDNDKIIIDGNKKYKADFITENIDKNLILEFSGESWIELYVENELVEAQIFSNGDIYERQIEIPFKIIVGNADFVKGSYNNTEIDFLTNANRLTGVNTINF